MKFLIQRNLMNVNQLEYVENAVKLFPHEFIELIPFSKEFTTEHPLEGNDYIPYGTTSLINLAYELGLKGLHFDLNVFNYEAAMKNRSDMLNSEYIMTAKEAAAFMQNSSQEWFIRPSEDLKHFTGQVIEAKECADWLNDAMSMPPESGTYAISPDMKVVIATVKSIEVEWRWFIVDGKIVDGSIYRINGRLVKKHVTEQTDIDKAQRLADIWIPDLCVVMDTALVDGELKVVEFNCINSSGFYGHAVDKIFESLWKFHNNK